MARRYRIERNGLGWIVRGGTIIHALGFLRRGRAVRVAVELERAYHDGVWDERHKDDVPDESQELLMDLMSRG